MNDFPATNPQEWFFKDGDFLPIPVTPMEEEEEEPGDWSEDCKRAGFQRWLLWKAHPRAEWDATVDVWYSAAGVVLENEGTIHFFVNVNLATQNYNIYVPDFGQMMKLIPTLNSMV